MIILPTRLEGVFRLTPEVFHDDRGQFCESYQTDRLSPIGVPNEFAQDNVSRSRQGVLRGLHFQNPKPQAKFLTVLSGEIFDVVVDLRLDASTFGECEGFHLHGKNLHQIFIPVGFAHGFCALSEEAVISYKCDAVYDPECQHTLAWNDPQLGIEWPIDEPILSPKDQHGMLLSDLKDQLFTSEDPMGDCPQRGHRFRRHGIST